VLGVFNSVARDLGYRALTAHVDEGYLMTERLTGISETLLIPLWARAVETIAPEPIVRDVKAAEIMAQIDYDFAKFESARLSQLGVAIRTMLLDNAVSAFVKRNPEGLVINVGAGLDTRHERLGLEGIDWYELDVPESMDLRRRFFAESEHYHFVAKSMFDDSWMNDINDAGRPVLLIAEGLFMYFVEGELKALFKNLVNRFPTAEMLVEVMGPYLVGKSKRHDSLSQIDGAPEFRWGLRDSRTMTQWCPGVRFIEEWCYFDYHKDRAGWTGRIVRLPFIRPLLAPRIVHLRFHREAVAEG
jgi:O-methyltransferase involved in polyketide biosynthesis